MAQVLREEMGWEKDQTKAPASPGDSKVSIQDNKRGEELKAEVRPV